MAKRGRKRAKTALKKATAFSVGTAVDVPQKVHPARDDCYPLNKLCRLCLLSNINMEPIFAYSGDTRLSDKIFECTNLKINESSEQGIPTAICGQCKKQLDQCHEFRLLCWKNNEVLQNLHAILNPKKTPESKNWSTPVVQLKKLDISVNHMQSGQTDLSKLYTPPRAGRKIAIAKRNFGEISLEQLYTPSRRGAFSSKAYPRFSKELVVRLVPMSASLINKYRKATVTKTKAAMKLFSQPKGALQRVSNKSNNSVAKAKIEKRNSPMVKKTTTKSSKVKKAAKMTPPTIKKSKTKRTEISMPPKKRKENFPTPVPAMVTCLLCTNTFNNQKTLSRHMIAHENNRKQNRVFGCEVCRKEYLKQAQLTEHLQSAEHIACAGPSALEETDVSILPDNDDEQMQVVSGEMSKNMSTTDAEAEEITDQPVIYGSDHRQPSPDTNDASQQEDDHTRSSPKSAEANQIEANIEPSATNEVPVNRDASPIPVDSESSISRDGGVQYSDVCSTNNAENLFNGSGTESFNSSRRVTFSDITEVVE
ncbi:uncharacterized protein LOC128742090 [Sabethes cyaneus]|uniref:uncharacterized protein LOC128742090 n=1 Tax=Sabethes cyaneus TaxID=53552 RepID=UPI00237DEACE|nr:uncharacterized protein LOC128742090 [Sabethes cyaneus]XP_053694280.1 uncharacterized protein LOC128742090 [Sabethes cyaneus]